MSAASQARKRADEDDLEIVAFERGRATSYSACGIPYWIGGAVGSEDELISRTPGAAPGQRPSTCGCGPRSRRSTWPAAG
jgi:NADPH-dependent 2,4-dienoyl-CoA reductase/sulfur reductase-like enzyme